MFLLVLLSFSNFLSLVPFEISTVLFTSVYLRLPRFTSVLLRATFGRRGCTVQRDKQVVVPLERNGQTVGLHQRKFFVAIPFAYSTAGYGFLFNMPGSGTVTVGKAGTGGMSWSSEADTLLDFWVTVRQLRHHFWPFLAIISSCPPPHTRRNKNKKK